MHPDLWSTVQRMLLLCCDELEAVLQLQDGVRSLHQSLPNADITLITPYSREQLSSLHSWVEVIEVREWDVGREVGSKEQYDQSLLSIVGDRAFDAAIIFTTQGKSPYRLAYLCYLAGIPLRLGQSREFGGGVLSHCVQPPVDPVTTTDYYLHLLHSIGLAQSQHNQQVQAKPGHLQVINSGI